MFMVVSLISLAALVCGAAYGILNALNPWRVNGLPSFTDLMRAKQRDLHIVSHAKISRQFIRGESYAAIEAYIDHAFGKATSPWNVWSIDWCHPHTDHNGRRQAGYWANTDGDRATIFFYKDKTPEPAPPPPPEATTPPPVVTGWSEADEKERIRSFEFNPLAFWLSPDWEAAKKAGEPFWMVPPAPIPNQASQDQDERVIEFLAEYYADPSNRHMDMLTHCTVTGERSYFFTDEDGVTEYVARSHHITEARRRVSRRMQMT